MFPWALVGALWTTESEGVGLIVRAISFQDFQPMWSLSTKVTDRRTDGQTDRQTDDMRSQYRALHCSASRGKNWQSRTIVWGQCVLDRWLMWQLWYGDLSYLTMYCMPQKSSLLFTRYSSTNICKTWCGGLCTCFFQILYGMFLQSIGKTRKLSYRKDDSAMCPI